MTLAVTLLATLIVFAFPGQASAQAVPRSTAQHGAFAFPNEEGSRLLATAEIGNPEVLYAALCTSGEPVGVRFERRQPEAKNFDGRQTPRNFAGVAGAVFQAVGGRVDAEATCFLVSKALVMDATVIPLEHTQGSRPATQVAIIEFARRLNQALASLVVIDGERRIYVDYPAEFKGPGADLWRVDDGGEIQAEGFKVVFLLMLGSSYVMAVDWRGAEGNALSLHVADTGDQFREVLTESWYRSPL